MRLMHVILYSYLESNNELIHTISLIHYNNNFNNYSYCTSVQIHIQYIINMFK